MAAPTTAGRRIVSRTASSPITSKVLSRHQSSASPSPTPPTPDSAKPQPQKYPLYPSVASLLRTNNLAPATASSKIPASGPNGRLLKGDVLSYLGRIDKTYSSQQSERITRLGHLDLSNIQKAEAKPAAKEEPRSKKEEKVPKSVEEEPPTEIAVPISFSAALATQRRVQSALGITLPLSTIIARASEIANQTLPAVARPPNSDELFDSVLGLDGVSLSSGKKTTRGNYVPKITALPPPSENHAPRSKANARDVIDELTGPPARESHGIAKMTFGAANVAAAETPSAGGNIFSLSVQKVEEKRARTYLERVKTVLEAEPGRCVL